MDPRQIKQSLIKRVIKILNANQKSLTPDVRDKKWVKFDIELGISIRGGYNNADMDY